MSRLDLRGKKAFIAGVGDDQGYGWAIACALARAGCEIYVGTWTPILKIFTTSFETGKFDESRQLGADSLGGPLLQIQQVYPLDALFDTPADVPQDILDNKRYQQHSGYTVSEVATRFHQEHGTLDILVHSLANGPEVKKPLLETSRAGYLAAVSSSSYSLISLAAHFAPFMVEGGSILSLTYIASERAVPGYGGGMSSAKAALESDTKTLAFELGRKGNIRINTISAGPLRSRAARAIGFIDRMISYAKANAPLTRDLEAEDVAEAALFLLSPKARGITGTTLYVDNGLHAMGLAMDSIAMQETSEVSSK